MSIEATRAGFEASFEEAVFYNKQTQDEKHLKDILQEKDLISDSTIKGTIEFTDSSNSEYKKERFLRQLG